MGPTSELIRTPESEANFGGAMMPEMPVTHMDVDPATLTMDGLISNCGFFAKLAEHDRETAESIAQDAIEYETQKHEMRQKGMSEEDIEDKLWEAMAAKHDEKSARRNLKQDETKSESEALPQIAPAAAITEEFRRRENEQLLLIRENILTEVETQNQAASSKAEKPDLKVKVAKPPSKPSAPTLLRKPLIPKVNIETEDQENKDEFETEARVNVIEQANLVVVKHMRALSFVRKFILKDQTPTIKKPPSLETSAVESLDDSAKGPEIINMKDDDALLIDSLKADVRIYDQPEQQVEEVEAEEPLPEIYLNFTEALQTFIELFEQSIEQAEPEDMSELHLIDDFESNEEQEPLPATIVLKIVESLSQLDVEEKFEITPLLTDINQKAQGIKNLITASGANEVVQLMQIELEVLIIELFERIECEYDINEVREFAAVLTNANFVNYKADNSIDVDLEHEGAHEAKLHFAKLASSLYDIEETFEQLIGKFVLPYRLKLYTI